MPTPIDPPLGSPRRVFLLRTWVVGVLAVGVCLAMTWLHFDQEEVLQRSGQWLRSFRAARIDLAKGFLHVSLAGEPESSFRREDGLALIDQALQGLSEAEARRIELSTDRSGAVAPAGNARIRELARVLREQVGAYRQADATTRRELELPMRLLFHDLERYAEQMDAAGQESLRRISARLNAQFAAMLGTSAALLGLMCLGVHQVERRQRRTEVDLRQSEARLRTLGDNIPGGALYQLHMPLDGPSRYTHVSAGFERIFGMPVCRILEEPEAFWALVVEDDHRRLVGEEQRCAREGAVLDIEFRQRTIRGEVKWIHARSMPRRLADGSILWDGVVADISARKAHEAEIERLTRLYATLSQINRGIVRVKTRVDLFQQVCFVTVKRGGFKVAWVGWRDAQGEPVRIVARARDGTGSTDSVLEGSDDQPGECGLVTQCLRSGRPCVVHDVLEVQEREPWHTVALTHQLRSAVAFPIRLQNEVHGAFAVFDSVPGAFQAEELDLLNEAAMDIEFGIQNLENESRRAKAEERLR
ncbi:MAG: GAF domain-containing protein, partial [Verrucomicrobiales bacterium]|nr:GAF domain-containing protein [Verrucomicrobiales bacterium]